MDVVSLFKRAAARFDETVEAVRDDQWTLPTPCTEWDVRALVNHLTGEDLWARPMLAGTTIAEVGTALDGDLLGADPLAAWKEALATAHAAVGAPGALTATVHASFAELSGEQYITQLFHDHLIHSWDLSRAIGADEALDPELVQLTYDMLAPQEEMLRASGAFGEHVDVPDDADAQTKLLALTGRRA